MSIIMNSIASHYMHHNADYNSVKARAMPEGQSTGGRNHRYVSVNKDHFYYGVVS